MIDTHDDERSLLGAAMLDPTVFDAVFETVTGSQFSDAAFGAAFDHLCDCYAAGRPVGSASVVIAELRTTGILDRLGGAAGVGTLLQDTPTTSGAVFHACQVARAYRLRRLHRIGMDLVDRATQAESDPDSLCDWIDGQRISVASDGHSGDVVTVSEGLRSLAESMRSTMGRDSSGVPTGIGSVDSMLGGLFPGDLVILAARPSVGKSAFGFQVAEHAATSGCVSLFVSLEMGNDDLTARYAAGHVGLSASDIRAGVFTEVDVERVDSLAASVASMPLHVWPTRSATVARIRGIARTVAARAGGLGLLVVDYLGLIATNDRRKPRWEQVTEISSELKTLAVELGVPLVALCQLGRDAEGHRPHLANLRESGAIEQDADVVMLMHRQRDQSATELILAKNRHGPIGSLNLSFAPDRCRFTEDF